MVEIREAFDEGRLDDEDMALLNAYGDSLAVEGYGPRNLRWRSSKWYSPKDLGEVWTLGYKDGMFGYNQFDVEEVMPWLEGWGVEVQPAREGSVAMYVRGDRDTLEGMEAEAYEVANADEAWMRGDDLRLWWD